MKSEKIKCCRGEVHTCSRAHCLRGTSISALGPRMAPPPGPSHSLVTLEECGATSLSSALGHRFFWGSASLGPGLSLPSTVGPAEVCDALPLCREGAADREVKRGSGTITHSQSALWKPPGPLKHLLALRSAATFGSFSALSLPEASDKGLQRAGAPPQACIHRKGSRTKPQKPSCPHLLCRTEIWLGFASDFLCHHKQVSCLL